MLNFVRSKKPYLQTRLIYANTLEKYVITSKIGGHSSEGLYELYKNYDNKAISQFKRSNASRYGISMITTPEQCKSCVEKLSKIDNIVAWDTETMDLDIKNQSPVGKGKILCASFYAGPEFNFGNGPRVFIDNFGRNSGLINYFKEYLESQKHKKAWHNYGFDRHIFYNHGINVRGFGGDTMHMARLYDPAKKFGEYSLASLTKEYQGGLRRYIQTFYIKNKKNDLLKALKDQNLAQQERKQNEEMIKRLEDYKRNFASMFSLRKFKMDELFRRKKILKNGEIGKIYEFPTTLTLHTSQQHIKKWVQYSCLDAQSTFFLRNCLELTLKNAKSSQFQGITSSWDIYQEYWRPFGQLLTDMQREGFKINLQHMQKIQEQAKLKIESKKKEFINFLTTFQEDENIIHFNPSSNLQMQQLLHAPFKVNFQESKEAKNRKIIMEDNELNYLENQDELDGLNQRDDGRKISQRTNLTQLPEIKEFRLENAYPELYGKTKVDMTVKGLGIPAAGKTATGLPSVDESSLKILAGSPKNGKYGKAYEYFKQLGQQQFGKKFSQAIQALIEYKTIETLLVTFIQPLQSYTDQKGRIHCSLNINTETGRLSSKKPNLQNQPALQKDIYKIRSAFTVEKGNKMIVADYGQLELRVLAHITNCKGMIQAFKKGGDFHSRTAIGMFDYIKEDIDKGKVLLEWDKAHGEAPAPLLKEKYASERKKAKTVNFSIAYGKTARGFAADWNCSLTQARQVIEKWFKDRPEVKEWQKKKQNIAKESHITQTLLGRVRNLGKLFNGGNRDRTMGMAMRRSINTPIQGGAADIVIASMVKIHRDNELREMGWKLILQIHDQLILEGPQESVDRALEIVRQHMMHPFEKDLLIELQVDSKIGMTWYECK